MKIHHLYILVLYISNVISGTKAQFFPLSRRLIYGNRALAPYLIDNPCCNEGTNRPTNYQRNLQNVRPLPKAIREGRSDEVKDELEESKSDMAMLKDLLLATKADLEKMVAIRDSEHPTSHKPADSTPFTTQLPPSTSLAPLNKEEKDKQDAQKAYECSELECKEEEVNSGYLCACNYNTGNTVSFKNACDLKRHNCRFDTVFKSILEDVCPWQFESRAGANENVVIDYNDSRYYNKE